MAGLSSKGPERQLDQRLDQFESEWKSGSPPDIRRYVPALDSTDSEFLANLVPLDLEYRWKRFDGSKPISSLDKHGFALFPKLEDYAALETIDREDIFTPELLAEEYRVRSKWGDRPDRAAYFTRFPDNPAELQSALKHVENELEIERPDPADSVGGASTVDHTQADSQTTGSPSGEASVPRRLDRYQLESLVGRGGFGEVWKAHDPKLDRFVAIKIPRPDKKFPPEVLADFEKEGQKLAKLGSIAGIVTVFDTGVCAGHTYIVSELVEGESLAQRQKRSPLSHEEVVQLISAVAEALHRAHLMDLVHRDIKPGNILLDKDGSPVIADFGLAVTETEQLVESRRVVGTLAYMPPEQVTGNSHLANAQADIYSLGVVLYQLLTKRLPFVAETFEEYREQITKRSPRRPRTIDDTIPKKLDRICLQCLAKRPEDRYPTARDLACDLRQALHRPTQYKRIITVTAAAGFILVGLFLVASLYPWRNAVSPPLSGEPPQVPIIVGENLLNRRPKDVVWDFGFEENNRAYLELEKRFIVDTIGHSAFSLGRTASNHFTFRVRFTVKDWRGRFGLMWGHGKKQIPRAASVELAHAILIKVQRDRSRLEFVELTFDKWNRKSIQTVKPLVVMKPKPVPAKQLEMELEIKDGVIRNLRVQDTVYHEIETPTPVFQHGDIGVFFSNGYFVLTEAWYHNKETKNARQSREIPIPRPLAPETQIKTVRSNSEDA